MYGYIFIVYSKLPLPPIFDDAEGWGEDFGRKCKDPSIILIILKNPPLSVLSITGGSALKEIAANYALPLKTSGWGYEFLRTL